MGHDLLPLDPQSLRGTDSNSLLRLFDRAKEIFKLSHLQQERARADRTIRRIAQELQKRKVPL